MAHLNKSTIALTFKFDCDRFLRFRLAKDTEIKSEEVPDSNKAKQSRPGINLITAQGRLWEASCYDDIVNNSNAHFKIGTLDEEIARKNYAPVTDLDVQLKKNVPPKFIIEAEFSIPGNLSSGLKSAIESGRLATAKGRPDLIWIQPFQKDIPLVKATTECEYIIHIFDIKLAAEPSMRHFVEVTFYALGLQAWLEQNGLANRYAVCAAGRIWPGTHTASEFLDCVSKFKTKGVSDPLVEALKEITKTVPFEVYQPRLLQFLDRRLPLVLSQNSNDSSWHVSKKCQLCEYFNYCSDKAKNPSVDHLSQLVDLTAGQAQVLRYHGISTLQTLRNSIRSNDDAWIRAKEENHTLRAAEKAIAARCEAMSNNTVVPIDGRRTAAMPKFTHLSIYLTAHFDPGTGITFAFGAKKVYFHTKGENPDVESITLLVDDINGNTSSKGERLRLIELCTKVQDWLEKLDATNKVEPDKYKKHKVQFYVWDQLEATQLGRVVARHLDHPDVLAKAAFLLRVFPPESELRSPEDWKAQPVTIVKRVVKNLVAFPLPFDYTLLDVRSRIDPFELEGKNIIFHQAFGFSTPLSDQIPLERAYELWQQRVMLQKYDPLKERKFWSVMSRDELRDEIKRALVTHLNSLSTVVSALQKQYGEKLLLRKEPFALSNIKTFNLPARSSQMLTFERLNAVAAELESQELLALPIEERDAQFHSIRGLVVALPENINARDMLIDAENDPRYSERIQKGYSKLIAFTFSPTSRDTRMREGAFTIVLRNEDSDTPLQLPWYRALGFKGYKEAMAAGKHAHLNKEYVPSKTLLQVKLVKLNTVPIDPLLVLEMNNDNFKMACDVGLIDLENLMVLDPFYKDFSGPTIEKALRLVGGPKNG